MKNLYREFFYVGKDEKIRDKVMTTRVVVTALFMLMCLAAMSITAYAFFSHNASSGFSTIQSANFDSDISVVKITAVSTASENANADSDTVPVVVTAKRTYTAALTPGVAYNVTIDRKGNATTGFCVIATDGCAIEYHTQQLGVNGDTYTRSITFTLTVQADGTEKVAVNFVPSWGTSTDFAEYAQTGVNTEKYILHKDSVTMIVDRTSAGVISDNEDTVTTTTTTTTITETTSTTAAKETETTTVTTTTTVTGTTATTATTATTTVAQPSVTEVAE